LAEASKRFGQVEHIVCSVPVRDYGLGYDVLRHRVVKVLRDRGVIGGVLIFHGFRYSLREWWYWSPHFHVLGFIAGGYRCRGCKRKCFKGCEGFDNRNYRCYEKDGYVVKVLGKRKTIGGTAWYQLNHSSIDITKKRFHVSTLFGVVSYRKLKIESGGSRRYVCPVCGHNLEKLRYVGDVKEIFCWHGALREDCVKRDFFDFYENERGVNWIPDFRSGSHEGG